MPSFLTIGARLKPELVPGLRLPPGMSISEMSQRKLFPRAQKHFVLAEDYAVQRNGQVLVMIKGTYLELVENQPGFRRDLYFYCEEKFASTRSDGRGIIDINIARVTPIVMKEFDKKMCIVEIDHKKDAMTSFISGMGRTHARHGGHTNTEETNTETMESLACPECGEDLMQIGITFRRMTTSRELADLSADRIMSETGEVLSDEPHQQRDDYCCPNCSCGLDRLAQQNNITFN